MNFKSVKLLKHATRLTNTDQHCFIDREDDVVREMRGFLSPTPP